MATDYSELGLTAQDVRSQLQTLGIDDLLYSDAELENLSIVSGIMLQAAIHAKAADVEAQLVSFQLETEKLTGLNEMFTYLYDQLAPQDATSENLLNFLEYEQNLWATGNTSDLALDYSLVVSGFSGERVYDTVQDYVSAIENNSATGLTGGTPDTLLYVEYQKGVTAGLWDNIYDSTGASGSFDQFLAGTAYLSVAQSDTDAPIVVLQLSEFKNYLIASALQEADYISTDTVVEPTTFADAGNQLDQTENDAAAWIDWYHTYFGKLIIDYDVDTEALTVAYNGMAAIRELGIDPPRYFGAASVTFDVLYYADPGKNPITDYKIFQETITNINWDMPLPFGDDDATALATLTAARAYGNLEPLGDLSGITEDDFPSAQGAHTGIYDSRYRNIESWTVTNWQWTELADEDLTQFSYIEGDKITDILTAFAAAIEGHASTSEISMLETSTTLTEWSELHNTWDTVHKYVNDATGRAVRMMR